MKKIPLTLLILVAALTLKAQSIPLLYQEFKDAPGAESLHLPAFPMALIKMVMAFDESSREDLHRARHVKSTRILDLGCCPEEVQ